MHQEGELEAFQASTSAVLRVRLWRRGSSRTSMWRPIGVGAVARGRYRDYSEHGYGINVNADERRPN